MSDRYKLVFRGEVLEGQHPAVVRKRLAGGAGFSDAALNKLFSGKPVVVKRDADTAAAARLQAVFKQAGARLRVLPVDEAEAGASAGPRGAAETGRATPVPATPGVATPGVETPGAAAQAPAAATPAGGFELLPPGSAVLRDDERTVFEPREVDTGDLKLEGARFATPASRPEPAAPDVSHLSVAQAGVDLGPGRAPPPAPVSAPELDVADVGADLSEARAEPVPAVDVETVNFDVAPAGAELGQRKRPEAPPPPDTSHLGLASADRD